MGCTWGRPRWRDWHCWFGKRGLLCRWMTNLCNWVSQRGKEKEVLCWIKTPLEEWVGADVLGWIHQMMGVRERLFNVVWEPAAGGTSFWGARARQGLCRTLPLRKLQVARLQGFHYLRLLSKLFHLADRIIFIPISTPCHSWLCPCYVFLRWASFDTCIGARHIDRHTEYSVALWMLLVF